MSDEKANSEKDKRAVASGREGMPAESAPQTMKSASGPPSSAMVLSGSEIEVVTDPSPQLGAPKPLTPPKPPPPTNAAVKPEPIEEVEPESVEKRPSFFDVFNVERYEQVEAEVKAEEEKLKQANMGKGGKGGKALPAPRQRQKSRPDEDLFNLSGGLFGTQPLAPLVAPDLSALSPGLSKELGAPPARPSAPAAQPAPAAAPAAAPLAAPVLTNTATAPNSLLGTATKAEDPSDLDFPKPPSRKKLFLGIAAAGALAVAAFLLVRGGSSDDPNAPAETASTETTPSDRAGSAPANDAPQAAPQQAAPAADPGNTAAKAPEAAGDKDKRATSDAKGSDRPADRDKAKTADKAPEKDPGGKTAPADTKPSSGGDKSQSLAAAMAAGTGNTAAPAPAAGGGDDFNASAARSALNAAAGAAAGCKKGDDPSGVAKVSVTFAPSGRATKAQVNGPPFAGTSTGGCIAAAFRSASVPPFSGSPVTVSKSVTIR